MARATNGPVYPGFTISTFHDSTWKSTDPVTRCNSSIAAASSAMLIGPMCNAECGDDNAGVTLSICNAPSSRFTTPNTSRSRGRSGESTNSVTGLSTGSKPGGTPPRLTPLPLAKAMTREWSSASTTRERLKPICRPTLITSRNTSNRRTSYAGSRIEYDIVTGAGTHSSSRHSGSGANRHSGAAVTPPVELRMSWRSGIISRSTPASITGVVLPR